MVDMERAGTQFSSIALNFFRKKSNSYINSCINFLHQFFRKSHIAHKKETFLKQFLSLLKGTIQHPFLIQLTHRVGVINISIHQPQLGYAAPQATNLMVTAEVGVPDAV